jgi:hypothetical protein
MQTSLSIIYQQQGPTIHLPSSLTSEYTFIDTTVVAMVAVAAISALHELLNHGVSLIEGHVADIKKLWAVSADVPGLATMTQGSC